AFLLGLLLVPAGCKKTDTILLVEISGPVREDLIPFQFLVTISTNIETRSLDVPETPHATILPASFSVALDRAHMGPITISITGRDEASRPILEGTTTQEHIVIGGQTIIPVMLTEIDDRPPVGSDGGAPDVGGSDAATDASDAGDGAPGQD